MAFQSEGVRKLCLVFVPGQRQHEGSLLSFQFLVLEVLPGALFLYCVVRYRTCSKFHLSVRIKLVKSKTSNYYYYYYLKNTPFPSKGVQCHQFIAS